MHKVKENSLIKEKVYNEYSLLKARRFFRKRRSLVTKTRIKWLKDGDKSQLFQNAANERERKTKLTH